MGDLMFLHPRDWVEIYDQKCDHSEQQRSHIVGCGEINGIQVVSDFYAFLAENGMLPEAVRSISLGDTRITQGVLMDDNVARVWQRIRNGEFPPTVPRK